MDPQLVELVKALTAPLVATGGITGWYLLYRKFDAERAVSLREDIKTSREERDGARKELRDERTEHKATRDELRAAEETIDELRERIRGGAA